MNVSQPNLSPNLAGSSLGFTPQPLALPPVTILQAQLKRGIQRSYSLRPGKLFQFQLIDQATNQSIDKVSALPIMQVDIPTIRLSPEKMESPDLSVIQKSFRVECSDSDRKAEMHFAFLPFVGTNSIPPDYFKLIHRFENLKTWISTNLKINVSGLGFDEIRIHPNWRKEPLILSPTLQSLAFSFAYAHELLQPLLFTLKIPLINKARISFTFPKIELEKCLQNYSDIINPQSSLQFSVIQNAIPMIQIAQQAWEPSESYQKFAQSSGAHPIGLAGIVPYRTSQNKSTLLKPKYPLYIHFGFEKMKSQELDNSESQTDIYYQTPSEYKIGEDNQLLFWTTKGKSLNGKVIRPNPGFGDDGTDIQFPTTGVVQFPFFGGADFPIEKNELTGRNLLKSISYGLPSTPSSSTTYSSIRTTLRELLNSLGYNTLHPIKGPFIELRNLQNIRQRTIVMYVANSFAAKILSPFHKDLLQNYLSQYLGEIDPIIVDVFLEER